MSRTLDWAPSTRIIFPSLMALARYGIVSFTNGFTLFLNTCKAINHNYRQLYLIQGNIGPHWILAPFALKVRLKVNLRLGEYQVSNCLSLNTNMPRGSELQMGKNNPVYNIYEQIKNHLFYQSSMHIFLPYLIIFSVPFAWNHNLSLQFLVDKSDRPKNT